LKLVSENKMPNVGDIIAEKYKIDKVLGEGGMGAVFAATHQITGKRVALKWMRQELANDEEAGQRFIREAQAAGRIDHPNVVDVYDVGKQGNTVFLVMEYLYGEPFTAFLERGQQDPTEIVQILIPAMRGVAAAHRQGVVHRDLKPDNIFLCRDPDGSPREAKVLDFGISKVSGGASQTSHRLTRTGTMMGTPYYMSPEQVRGSKEIGPQVDVYAFGVILYEALAGRVPFHADTFSALVLEIATSTATPLREVRPDIPEKLEAIVNKAMARETKDRYKCLEDLGRDVELFGGGVTFDVTSHNIRMPDFVHSGQSPQPPLNVTSTPFSSEAPVSSIPGKRRGVSSAVIGLAGAAVIVLAGAGIWTFTGKTPTASPSLVRPASSAPAMLAPAPVPVPPAVKAEPLPLPTAKEPEVEPIPAAVAVAPVVLPVAITDRDSEDKNSVSVKAESDTKSAKHVRAERSSKRTSRSAAARSAITTPSPAVPTPAVPAATEHRARSNSRTGGFGLDEF
jgi:eukaryotic-like serine/threonine-protein kinase